MYSRRSDIQFNPVFNSIKIDIERSELRSTRHMSVILVYRPPNTDSSIFINDIEKILSKLDSENRDIFMIGDFNYDTFKTSSFKPMNIESEIFTNRLAEFNMYKLIHKPTRVKPPSATLLDNIYTNIQITIDNCESGIITSNISDHFFVFGFFDNMKINQTKNYIRKRNFTEGNISKFTKKIKKIWDHLDLLTKAQDSFSFFYDLFTNTFENIFREKYVEIKYKNRHTWMPNSLKKSIKKNHTLYKLSITNPTEANTIIYKIYNNKLNSIKRKAEREYLSNQLEINKSDMRKSWKIMKSVIGTKRQTNNNKNYFLN